MHTCEVVGRRRELRVRYTANRVDTVKFVAAQEACRLCLDQVPGRWKDFLARVRDQAYISRET